MDLYKVKLSGADPVGKVFFDGNYYYRFISDKNMIIKEMFENGFFYKLINEKYIPDMEIYDEPLNIENKEFDIIIKQESISPITYPREWSFEVIKAAAIKYINLVEISKEYGYGLKDCHLFNFVFKNNNPLWVDIGSFFKLKKDYNAFPITDFLSSIVFPLKLWSKGSDKFANRLLSSPIDTITEDDLFALRKSIKKLSYPRILKKIYNKIIKVLNISINTKKIKKHILKLKSNKKTMWSEYHSEYYDSNNNIIEDSRFKRIIDILSEIKPKSIIELAGNAGILSEKIYDSNICDKIICTDYDYYAVDTLFLNLIKNKKSIIPVRLDFMVREGSISEISSENRFKSECVIALAVTHHLLLTQGYDYDEIFESVGLYTEKYIIIEYMPLGLWNGKTAPKLPDWYNEENFSKNFNKYFEILKTEKLDDNRIMYFGQKKYK